MKMILALLLMLAIGGSWGMAGAGTIYYYEGSDGVLHFTDIPLDQKYKAFVFWGNATGEAKQRIKRLIKKYASYYGVNENLVLALAHVESRYDAKAISRTGAQGVMQIMPETQKELGLSTPLDPAANVEAGIRYFKRMLDRFEDVRLALAAYNAGPGHVDKYQGIPPFPETRQYIEDVLTMYAKLQLAKD
ncbi:MAG: lytic transglycosylase [Deltaproteobacteria bacterium]|nr:MAG: lytic transglycosylase [Deltaproteobacteria bacterium]